jgi:hypothetical protein
LAGIILNDGIRYSSVRVEQLRFGEATPFDTVLARCPSNGARVLPHDVVAVLQQELLGVVREDTGRRLAHGLALGDGRVLTVGGKTGTGDNRFQIAGPAGRRPLVLNRTATFVFVLGSRFFGTSTAYVPGQAATSYTFTSSLTVELLRRLGPALRPLLRDEAAADSVRNQSRCTTPTIPHARQLWSPPDMASWNPVITFTFFETKEACRRSGLPLQSVPPVQRVESISRIQVIVRSDAI